MSRVVLAAVVAAVLATSSRSYADDEAFAEIKRRGDEALVAGRAAEALAAYDEAYALVPDPALLFNRGRAHMALGDYVAALGQLEEFEKKASPELRAKVPGLMKLLGEVRAKVSEVVLTCNVQGATVRLGGRDVGTTPISHAVRAHAGRATLEVTKDGYLSYQKELELRPAGVTILDVRLADKATEGILALSTSVVGARVAVDGKDAGMAPTELLLGGGSHRIRIARDGYVPRESDVVVKAGERQSLSLDLEREAPITKKWWFWTGIGLVAIGGAVTAVALTMERDPGTGSLGNIKAGLSF